MNMGQAIQVCFNKYATFEGRARRSEYWMFYLFYFIVYMAASLVGKMWGSEQLLTGVAALVFFLPGLAAAVRRLHDMDKSGWFVLVPIYNVILLASEGANTPNRFGNPVK